MVEDAQASEGTQLLSSNTEIGIAVDANFSSNPKQNDLKRKKGYKA